MLTDSYIRKIKPLITTYKYLYKFRFLLMAAGIVSAATATSLVSIKGMIIHNVDIQNVTYGEKLNYQAKSIFNSDDLKYEFNNMVFTEPKWTSQVPTSAGDYQVRAVSSNAFGGVIYSDPTNFKILPKEIKPTLVQDVVMYGETPQVQFALNEGDEIRYQKYKIDNFSGNEGELIFDENSFKIGNAKNKDVTSSYNIDLSPIKVKLTPRPITISGSVIGTYDGSTHTFTNADLKLESGSLVYNDTFEIESTNANYVDPGLYDKHDIKLKFNHPVGDTFSDVTSLYDPKISNSIISIDKRTFTVQFPDFTKKYDGKFTTLGDYKVIEGSLLPGHRFDFTCNQYVDVCNKQYEILNPKILDADGIDVTDKYHLGIVPGNVTITPLEVTITTASQDYIYDGTYHSNISFSVDKGGFIEGHELIVEENNFLDGDVGTFDNKLSFNILDSASQNVNENYNLTINYGSTNITKKLVNVKTKDIEIEFNSGVPANLQEHFIVDETELAPNQHFEAVSKVYYSDKPKDTFVNDGQVSIKDASGVDQTKNYDIQYTYGTVSVKPKTLTFSTGSAFKVYDPNNPNFVLEKPGFLQETWNLPNGYQVKYKDDYSKLSTPGSMQNICNPIILNELGEDVTSYFDLDTHWGTLTLEDVSKPKPEPTPSNPPKPSPEQGPKPVEEFSFSYDSGSMFTYLGQNYYRDFDGVNMIKPTAYTFDNVSRGNPNLYLGNLITQKNLINLTTTSTLLDVFDNFPDCVKEIPEEQTYDIYNVLKNKTNNIFKVYDYDFIRDGESYFDKSLIKNNIGANSYQEFVNAVYRTSSSPLNDRIKKEIIDEYNLIDSTNEFNTIFNVARYISKYHLNNNDIQNPNTLENYFFGGKTGDKCLTAQATVTLLRNCNIPARIVQGSRAFNIWMNGAYNLNKATMSSANTWVEAYSNDIKAFIRIDPYSVLDYQIDSYYSRVPEPISDTELSKFNIKLTVNWDYMGQARLSNTHGSLGETVTLSVSPYDGYLIDSVDKNGGTLVKKSDNLYEFTPTSNRPEIIVNFKQIPPKKFNVWVKCDDTRYGYAYSNVDSGNVGEDVYIYTFPNENGKVESVTSKQAKFKSNEGNTWIFTPVEGENVIEITFVSTEEFPRDPINGRLFIQTQSIDVIYDALEHSETYISRPYNLLPYDELKVESNTIATNVGTYKNVVKLKIFDTRNNKDVTHEYANYGIDYNFGTITIRKARLLPYSNSNSKYYDGTPLKGNINDINFESYGSLKGEDFIDESCVSFPKKLQVLNSGDRKKNAFKIVKIKNPRQPKDNLINNYDIKISPSAFGWLQIY